MQTSGHGNDALMLVVPIAVSVIVGVTLYGGPTHALTELNAILANVAYDILSVVSGIL